MSTAAQDFITEAKEQYWYDMFIKVTGYWYGNETPNMDKEEFIVTRIRRAPQIEREKGEREAEENALLYSHYCHICGDHDGKHNEDCTAYVPGITPNP